MPARGSVRAAVMREGRHFFLSGHAGRLARIETHEHNLVVAPSVEGKHLERANDTLLHLITKHRTAVVDQGEKDGLAAKIVAEMNVAAAFIAKVKVQRDLAIERRLEAHIPQSHWQARGRPADIDRH